MSVNRVLECFGHSTSMDSNGEDPQKTDPILPVLMKSAKSNEKLSYRKLQVGSYMKNNEVQ